MGVLIDTSILVDHERRGRAEAAVLGPQPVAVAAVTVAELLHGVRRAVTADQRARREAFVDSLLDWLPVITCDLLVAR